MADVFDSIARGAGEVMNYYSETSKLEWKLAVNGAISEAARNMDKGSSEAHMRATLYNSTAGLRGIADDSYRKVKIEETVQAFMSGRYAESVSIFKNELRMRNDRALNSFTLGESSLTDVDRIFNDVYSGAEGILGKDAVEIMKRDSKSQATLYGLSLMTPDDADTLVREKYKDVLSDTHLRTLLNINENKRVKAQSAARVNSVPKVTLDLLNNKIDGSAEFEQRMIAAGYGNSSFSPVSLYNELQNIRSSSVDQLQEMSKSEDPNIAALAATRLLAIKSLAPANVIDFAFNSGLEIAPLDYGSKDSIMNRLGEVYAYSQRFGQNPSSLFTKAEMNDLKGFFNGGNATIQTTILRSLSVIDDPFFDNAVANDLTSLSSLARAKALIVSINGRDAETVITAIDRGRNLNPSKGEGPNQSKDRMRRELKDVFAFMGEETADSFAEAMNYYARATDTVSINPILQGMIGSSIGTLGGSKVSSGAAYDFLGNVQPLSPMSRGPYNDLASPPVLLPPGMTESQAKKSYVNTIDGLVRSGDIVDKVADLNITADLLKKVAYPVTLAPNLYGIVIPGLNGYPYPLTYKNTGLPVKISLDYSYPGAGAYFFGNIKPDDVDYIAAPVMYTEDLEKELPGDAK